MRARAGALGMLCGLALASPASAQVTLRTTGQELGNVVTDVAYIWTAPFHASSRSWLDAAAAAATFAVLLPADDDIDAWIVDHPRAVPLRLVDPFRERHKEIARLVTARRILPMSAVLVTAGMLTGTRGLREAGYGCVSGWTMSNSMRYAIYAAVSRERPSSANGDQHLWELRGGEWEQHSFIGGHAMNAWTCITFLNTRFDLGVAEPLLYGVAAASALARMADRRHWASDTFLGVVIGYASGRTIAGRYARREERRERRELSLRETLLHDARIVPTVDGAAVAWVREF